MTLDECLSRVDRLVGDKGPGFPVFIDVAGSDDYRIVREVLEQKCATPISVADFVGGDLSIDLGRVLMEVRNSFDGVLVTGLSAYLHLRNREETLGFILDTEYCVTGSGPCFVLTLSLIHI